MKCDKCNQNETQEMLAVRYGFKKGIPSRFEIEERAHARLIKYAPLICRGVRIRCANYHIEMEITPEGFDLTTENVTFNFDKTIFEDDPHGWLPGGEEWAKSVSQRTVEVISEALIERNNFDFEKHDAHWLSVTTHITHTTQHPFRNI